MVATIHDVLSQFRQYATEQRGKGDAFERLMAAYLRLDPLFADRFIVDPEFETAV
ncbi:hypothetical protein ACSSZE_16010 [Acidithiobacillus caldus]